jgi:lysozyme family protein
MSFEKSVGFVLKAEGGYVNDPDDPGGETKYGISKRAYPNEDIRNLTRERAIALYKRDYWDPAGCDRLPPRVAACVFNSAVNNGVRAAIKLLQRAVKETPDGVIGPATLRAVATYEESDVVTMFLQEQLFYYFQLTGWRKYGRGWTRRQFDLAQFLGEL